MVEQYLYYVDCGYACFGLISEGAVITMAPPIARWTFVRRKGYKIEYISPG